MHLRRMLTSLAVAVGLAAALPAIALADHVHPTDDQDLDPLLELAYTFAERDAAKQGVPLAITSGRRTWAEQQSLWQQGIAEHGSPQAAKRWVLPPQDSAHVAGKAIDVRPEAGARWLERNGYKYGLCRVYTNEWWHFEVATIPFQKCPALVRDASVQVESFNPFGS